MAELKGIEKFVAESLQTFFLKSSKKVFFDEGSDPPDIYLNLNDKKISVEITEINQNVLKNRKTIDYGYLSFIKNLNKEFKNILDKDKKLLIFFHHNHTKVSQINKEFKNYIKSIIIKNEIEIGDKIEDIIGNVNFTIKVLEMPKNGKIKIAGATMPFGGKIKKSRNINTVTEQISDSNLSLQTYNIVMNRIQDKIKKCKDIQNPIWLALYDNYYNKFTYFDNQEHIEHYKDIFNNINDVGIFDKVLIVFENGDVLDVHT